MIYSQKNPLLRWMVEEGAWQVEEELSAYWNDMPFKVEIKFKTDLASIPQFLRSVLPQVGRHIQAAIFHDLIYRTKGHWGLTRAQADQMFLDGMEYSGVRWTRRYALYWGVRAGGWVSWENSSP